MSTDNRHWGLVEVETRAHLAEKLALLDLQGMAMNYLVRELRKECTFKVTATTIRHLRKHPRYHEVTQVDQKAQLTSAVLQFRVGCANQIPDALVTLKKENARGNLKATEIIVKGAAGIFDTKDAPEQQQAIQIIMASDTSPKK